MTATAEPTDSFDRTEIKQFPHRWTIARAGIQNVWHYWDNEFVASGGRFILRGTNGSGKSRALEMLLPFLLDADRRNMGTGSAVKMEDLMRVGSNGQTTRLGYLWLELERSVPEPGTELSRQYLTVGALVRYSESAAEAKVWYFTTELRVGHELQLIGAGREPLSRKELGELIGDDRIVDSPERHRERIASLMFGATGELGKDRFDGLMKLLHTLRAPDVGNRIEEGKLPAIVSDSLPPLSEGALTNAGSQLDGLKDTRSRQQALLQAREEVRTLLTAYRRYTTGVIAEAAQAVQATAAAARKESRNVEQLLGNAELLTQQQRDKVAEQTSLADRAGALSSELEGLKESDAYRSAKDLNDRERTLGVLASGADLAFTAAHTSREVHRSRVGDADRDAHEAVTAVERLAAAVNDARRSLLGIGLTEHNLPAAVTANLPDQPHATVDLRIRRAEDPTPVDRPTPAPLTIVPAEPDQVAEPAERSRRAAEERGTQAANRARDAADLARAQQKVEQARSRADDADTRADTDREQAETAASGRDSIAIELAEQWRLWVADPDTPDLLGADIAWAEHPALGPVLTDTTELIGTDSRVDLRALDHAVDQPLDAAIASLTHRVAAVDTQRETIAAEVDELTHERAARRAERDPDPEQPFWQFGTDGLPLWRCLDFTADADPAARSGIEGALHAASLLTATVHRDGTIIAADGQLLLLPAQAALDGATLDAVLTPDENLPAETAELVRAALAAIGYTSHPGNARPDSPIWIAADGSWRNGPLTGRHTPAAARFIGAAARAQERARRLAEIEARLTELADIDRSLTDQRSQLLARQQRVRSYVRDTGPQSRPLEVARAAATTAATRAAESAATAATRRTEADTLAQQWAAQQRAHQALCAEWGLPVEQAALSEIASSARHAADSCRTVVTQAASVRAALARHQRSCQAAAGAEQVRDQAETTARTEWSRWHEEERQLQTLRDAVGKDVAEVTAKIARASEQLRKVRERTDTVHTELRALDSQVGEATANLTDARRRAGERAHELVTKVGTLEQILNAPGVLASALPDADEPPTINAADPRRADADCEVLLAMLKRARSDETQLAAARIAFARSMQSTYDLVESRVGTLAIIELTDSAGRRTLAAAAADLERRCEEGQRALTEREQQVFRDFVLGDVAEELRRRLSHAESLVGAMNTSLRSIRTSHGIGVRLTWKLAEDASGDVGRIKTLVATAASVRTPLQDEELLRLLSDRVSAEAGADPSAGSATHLRRALDYRSWHSVDVIITGPEKGRERRISRRAKLSQGETRFVSYVTLFAAVDAYLSGLTPDGSNLRLILLDDAFAKVDEPTIAELLGLLVRLDVDFVMTGHALWGCYPQVPALDIYEVCRDEGSPAVTARVHWDGKTQSFLRSV
ncbi:TIGR02680 family protein [Jatrophihabitans sp.]|uniref:TIGR02680 family protein n=1 Tax=Jatrophihabitans sp. TaxID=1932789 RepID=UPI002C4B2D2D|nr:TIGR02680 family protein [Jatrophihabitans sp.]